MTSAARCHAPIGSGERCRRDSSTAAAAVALAVNIDLDTVGIGAVAHPIAALRMDDVHADPRRPVDFAGDANDHPRGWLNDLRTGCIRLGEHHSPFVDRQAPERLGPERAIGGSGRTGRHRRRRRWG